MLREGGAGSPEEGKSEWVRTLPGPALPSCLGLGAASPEMPVAAWDPLSLLTRPLPSRVSYLCSDSAVTTQISEITPALSGGKNSLTVRVLSQATKFILRSLNVGA